MENILTINHVILLMIVLFLFVVVCWNKDYNVDGFTDDNCTKKINRDQTKNRQFNQDSRIHKLMDNVFEEIKKSSR